MLRCANYKRVESLYRSVQLCCRDETWKPLYKQEMYALKVNSTRNFNTAIGLDTISFAVLRCTFLCLCLLLLSETAAESRPILNFVYAAVQSLQRSGRLSSPPQATASYFATLKSTVNSDGWFLVLHSSHRAECFLYLYTRPLPSAGPLGAVGYPPPL